VAYPRFQALHERDLAVLPNRFVQGSMRMAGFALGVRDLHDEVVYARQQLRFDHHLHRGVVVVFANCRPKILVNDFHRRMRWRRLNGSRKM